MGKMRQLALGSSKGTFGPGITSKMLCKYLVGMHMLYNNPQAFFWRPI